MDMDIGSEDSHNQSCILALTNDPECRRLIGQQKAIKERMEPLMSDEFHSLFMQHEEIEESLRNRIKTVVESNMTQEINRLFKLI